MVKRRHVANDSRIGKLYLVGLGPGEAQYLTAAALAARNYEPTLGQIVYGSKGNFLPMFLGCVVLSMVPSVVAMILGISSAGQRRNDKPTHSWIGFFVGGSVLTFDLILVIALLMLRLQKPM